MSEWKLTEGDQSTFIYELGDDGINKWNCDVQPGFSGGERASSEYLHSIALKMRAADELYEALEESNRHLVGEFGINHPLVLANRQALAKARGEM